MQHNQAELNNVSRNVIRDMRPGDGEDRIAALVQRACRHYAEMMEPMTMENQKPVRGPLHDLTEKEDHMENEWAKVVLKKAREDIEDNEVSPMVDDLMDFFAGSDFDMYTAMVAAFIAADDYEVTKEPT